MGAALRVAHVPDPADSGPVSSGVADTFSTPVPGTSRTRAKHLVVRSFLGRSQTAVASDAGVAQQVAARWCSPQSDALPNVGHLVSEGGSWAATVARLLLAEIEPVRPVALSAVQAAELALQVLEASNALLRFVAASTHGRLTPELALDAAKASLTIHRLTGDLHPGLLTLAREGR